VSERVRTPALAPPSISPATARDEDPSSLLAAHYERLWATRMHDLPFVNPALAVEVAGFRRCSGDWVGVVITPWFLNLFLIDGGGSLWGDIPAGERRYVGLPCGTVQFIADVDPDFGPYQYSPLIAPVGSLPDMVTARQVAADALAAVFLSPADAVAAGAMMAKPPPAAVDRDKVAETVSRRVFLRKLAGRR
jgi:[NiFe] hydrogenase assembly HybE family chaperone